MKSNSPRTPSYTSCPIIPVKHAHIITLNGLLHQASSFACFFMLWFDRHNSAFVSPLFSSLHATVPHRTRISQTQLLISTTKQNLQRFVTPKRSHKLTASCDAINHMPLIKHNDKCLCENDRVTPAKMAEYPKCEDNRVYVVQPVSRQRCFRRRTLQLTAYVDPMIGDRHSTLAHRCIAAAALTFMSLKSFNCALKSGPLQYQDVYSMQEKVTEAKHHGLTGHYFLLPMFCCREHVLRKRVYPLTILSAPQYTTNFRNRLQS